MQRLWSVHTDEPTLESLIASAGPLLLPGTSAATDLVYGFMSWGLISPDATGECGAAGDLDFFVNVAALAEFIKPFRQQNGPTAGRRMLGTA